MSSMHGRKVLLTDGRNPSCLALTRAMGRGGVEVHVGETFKHNITAYSRHSAASHLYPSANEEPDAFKSSVLEIIEREGYDFVIPIRDETTIALAEIQDRLPPTTKTLLSTPNNIERLDNKAVCVKLAEEVGVPIPRTFHPAEMALEAIAREASFPVLVKPSISSGARGIEHVERPEDLAAAVEHVDGGYGDVIVQEFVDHGGGHFSIGTVFDRDANPQALHVYKELLQYPDSGGPAVQAVSVPVESWVDDMLELLRAVDWVGPAHMDVLYDPADETYKLLEVNPRIWMSINLTIASGVEIPDVIMNLADGNDVTEKRTYCTDIYYRWVLPNEILWRFSEVHRLPRIRSRGIDRNGRVCYGVLSREDPRTILGVCVQSITFLLDGEKRRLVLGRGW